MADVYSTTRPGRPNLAVLLSAGVLLAALGGAALQVAASRALGPAVAIPGTKLTVRPPKGWTQVPGNAGTFSLLVRGERAGGEESYEKQIRFDAGKLPLFLPAERFFDPQTLGSQPVARKVAELNGLQAKRRVKRRLPRLFGGYESYIKETVVRVAVSPRGDFVRIEYDPLTEMTTADEELLEDICRQVRLEEPGLRVSEGEAISHAGLEWSAGGDRVVAGPEIAESRGFYVGSVGGEELRWSIGVHRTFLSAGRSPRDLVRDFVTQQCEMEVAEGDIVETEGGNGARTATYVVKASSRSPLPVVSVRVTAAGATRAALLLTCAAPRHAAEAEAAARAMSEAIRFVDDFPVGAVADEAGREIVERIAEKGLGNWWGGGDERGYYLGERVELSGAKTFDAVVTQRTAARGKSGVFESESTALHTGYEEYERWTVSADGRSYELERVILEGGASGVPVEVRESRLAGASEITRTVRYSGGPTERRRSRKMTVGVGAGFLSRPLEEIAELETARSVEGGSRMFQVSNRMADGLHGRLLTPLPPDKEGRVRVLVTDDFSPQPVLIGFEADGVMAYQQSVDMRLQRTTREAVLRRFPGLRRG